jgi:hypothetical protein
MTGTHDRGHPRCVGPAQATPAYPLIDSPEGAELAMSSLESPDYQIARDRIKGNPVIAQMAVGVATVPLAELAMPR